MPFDTTPRRNITLTLITLMLVLVVIAITSTSYLNIEQHKKEKIEFAKDISKVIEYEIDQYVYEYSYQIERILATVPLASIIKEGDREKLYKVLEPEWKL